MLTSMLEYKRSLQKPVFSNLQDYSKAFKVVDYNFIKEAIRQNCTLSAKQILSIYNDKHTNQLKYHDILKSLKAIGYKYKKLTHYP